MRRLRRAPPRVRRLLLWLRCWQRGHDFSGSFDFTHPRPGVWRCYRCQRDVQPNHPLTREHLAVLQRTGWTEAEIRRAFPELVPFLLSVLLLVTSACGGSSSTAPSPVTAPAPIVTPAPIVPPPPAVVRDPARFDQGFWNQFVHNGFEQPNALMPLRRLTAAPMLYLKTVDEAGVQIDPVTLSQVDTALRDVALALGGGQFGLAGLERGTSTKVGQPGWLTVRWLASNVGAICGQSTVGIDGGVIDLNYQNAGTSCTCPGFNIRPRTVKHELGHAFGYYHTDSQEDLMRNGALGCDANPSAREIYHAQIAYLSPIGTTTALPYGRVMIED